MNFALLGDAAAVRPLVAAIAGSAHSLSHAAHVGEFAPSLLERNPSLHLAGSWEELLPISSIDAVIVCGCDAAVRDGARQFATSGTAIILFPCYCQDIEFVYQLTLIRDDRRVPLFAVLPQLQSMSLGDVSRELSSNAIGQLLELRIERHESVEQRSAGLSATEIDEHLLSDIAALRYLGGNYTQVTAVRVGEQEQHVMRQMVTLAGENLPAASWTITSSENKPHTSLTIVGRDGEKTFGLGGDASTNDGTVLLERIEQFLQEELTDTTWSELTRSFETVEATHRSLRKRRTIDLHFEGMSERAIFKSHMAALGCGVLMFTLFGLVLYLITASLFDWPKPLLQIARILWLLPLMLYLGMQLLIFVTKPSDGH